MSQIDAESKTIAGHTYKVLPLDPYIASDMAWDVLNTLAPLMGAMGGKLVTQEGDALGKLMEGVKAEEKNSGEDYSGAFERAILGFFNRFTKKTQREFIQTLLKVSYLSEGGKEPRLDSIYAMHFRGRLMAQYQWLAFALRVQFGDFFSEFGPVINRFAQKLGPVQ